MALDLFRFKPSPQQAAVADWMRNGTGNAFVSACAGSGKTTTLEWLAKTQQPRGIFLAFNAEIAAELDGRLKGTGMAACTVHSHGYAACAAARRGRKLIKEDRKYASVVFPVIKALAQKETGEIVVGGETRKFTVAGQEQTLFGALFHHAAYLVRGLLDKARLTLQPLSDPAAVEALITAFNLEPAWLPLLEERHSYCLSRDWGSEARAIHGILGLLRAEDPTTWLALRTQFLATCTNIATTALYHGFETFRAQGKIDFTDMLWLPVALNLPVRGAPWIFVDEVQDISACARELVSRALRAGGAGARALFVGDENQAIYGFSGADAEAIHGLTTEFNCTRLPLSTTYRCPRTVTALAQTWQPSITARPDAPAGIVDTIDWTQFTPKPGDLVLCRTTAPLVATCWWLLDKGTPAYVAGTTIGEGLVRVARDIASKPRFSWRDFPQAAKAHGATGIARILKENGGDPADERISTIQDNIAAVTALWMIDQPQSAAAFEATVNRLFKEVKLGQQVKLATVHRAKGLEAEHVYLLKPQKMPLVFTARTAGELQQEANLQYVTVTRAKAHFTFVTGLGPPGTREHDKKTGEAILDTAWPCALLSREAPAAHEPPAQEFAAAQSRAPGHVRDHAQDHAQYPVRNPTQGYTQGRLAALGVAPTQGRLAALGGALAAWRAAGFPQEGREYAWVEELGAAGLPDSVLDPAVCRATETDDAQLLLICAVAAVTPVLGMDWTLDPTAFSLIDHEAFATVGIDLWRQAAALAGPPAQEAPATQEPPAQEFAAAQPSLEEVPFPEEEVPAAFLLEALPIPSEALPIPSEALPIPSAVPPPTEESAGEEPAPAGTSPTESSGESSGWVEKTTDDGFRFFLFSIPEERLPGGFTIRLWPTLSGRGPARLEVFVGPAVGTLAALVLEGRVEAGEGQVLDPNPRGAHDARRLLGVLSSVLKDAPLERA